jgi:transposase-like protein
MAGKREKPEEIVSKLRQVEVLQGQGMTITEAVRQSFRSLRSAKATLSGIETIRTIKRGHFHHKQPGVHGKIVFIVALFEAAA